MAINSVPISGLVDFGAISTGDFIPLVDSSSLTTVRTSIQEFFAFMAITASCLSASNTITSSYAHIASLAYLANTASLAITASQTLQANQANTSSWANTASLAIFANGATFASSSTTASFASNAPNANNAKTASFLLYAGFPNGTASYALNAGTANSAISTSFATHATTADTAISCSNALTASFVASTGGITFLDTTTIVASSPATVANPSSSWANIIRVDQVYLAQMNTTADTYISSTPNSYAALNFHAYNAPGVPSNAKAVILEAIVRTTWPDNNTDAPTVILARKNTSTSWLCITAATNADPGNAGQTSVGQMMCPLDTGGIFYWVKTTTGPHGGCYGYMIRIVGYVT